jgi:hypothetical protein
MLIELSLSKKEYARYRQQSARLGISVEQLIIDAVRNLRHFDTRSVKR